jgi:hypothetical protein
MKLTARESYYKELAEVYYQKMVTYQKALMAIHDQEFQKKKFRLTRKQINKVAFKALYSTKD